MIAFGPVPSRRLGQSLGINNIPPKVCTYACIYCQLGRTLKMQIERRAFYEPEKILQDVEDKVEKANAAGERMDYLTFVPDGEPTLDIHLGRGIEMLRRLGIKIAVITNSSLIWQEGVREALLGADWVSLKVDAVQEEIWRQVDRPHGNLELGSILEGALEFAKIYKGKLVTETMLVEEVNDSAEQVGHVADFLARLGPATAYLAIPTRPPAEKWVQPPEERVINQAYQILQAKLAQVELITGYEGNAFALTGDVGQDLLGITAVHPMREEALDKFLTGAGVGWSVVDDLVLSDQLVEVKYKGQWFFMRNLDTRQR